MTLKMLILAIATSLGALAIATPSEQALATKQPILKASRTFPAQNTVANAAFFYTHVEAEKSLPSANLSILFVAEEASKDASRNFSTSQSHASTLKSNALGVKKLIKAVQECFTKLHKPETATAETTIKIDLANRKKSVVAHLLFEKNKKQSISATLTMYGHAEKVTPPMLNLFKAVLLDDTLAQKHWGKMATLGGAVAAAAGLAARYVATAFDDFVIDSLEMNYDKKSEKTPPSEQPFSAFAVGEELTKNLRQLGYTVAHHLGHGDFNKQKLCLFYPPTDENLAQAQADNPTLHSIPERKSGLLNLRDAHTVKVDAATQAPHIFVITRDALTQAKTSNRTPRSSRPNPIKQALLNGWYVFIVGEVSRQSLPSGAFNIYKGQGGIIIYGECTEPKVSHHFLHADLQEGCKSITEKLYPANPSQENPGHPALTPAKPERPEDSSDSENDEPEGPPSAAPLASSFTTPTRQARRAKETPAKTPVTKEKTDVLLQSLLNKLQFFGKYTDAARSDAGIIPLIQTEARIRYFEGDQECIKLKFENPAFKYIFIHRGEGQNYPHILLKNIDEWNSREPNREKHVFIGFYENKASSILAEGPLSMEIQCPEDSEDVFDATITSLARIIMKFNQQTDVKS